MTWTPERPGNWLFHCHMILHMSPSRTLHPPDAKPGADAAGHDHSAGMGGLVIGITVVPGTTPKAPPIENRNARKLQLVISENPEKIPLYKLDLNDPAAPKKQDEKKQPAFLGPAIILTRGESVAHRSCNRQGKVVPQSQQSRKDMGAGMTVKAVRHIVKESAKRIGVAKLAPHDLRRTCARLCHASGGELEQIQFLLGHVSV